MAINLENKKQLAIMGLAIGLGFVAAWLMGMHIEGQIQTQTEQLAQQAAKRDQQREKDIALLKQEINQLAARQMEVAKLARNVGTRQGAGPAAPAIPKSSLALRMPPGKRALTVSIDSLSAVGGLINPGDYVDIIGHLKIPKPPNVKGAPDSVTAILFQNVQVLAVGTNFQETGGYEQQQKSRALNITFAVDPEEAGLMTFSQTNGKLQLVLRSPDETEMQMLQVASWEALSDYTLDRHGMEIAVPRSGIDLQAVGPASTSSTTEEVKPYIQIFKGGREEGL